VEGAWFRDGETRMDDQQHALAAMLRTIPILEASPHASDDAASAWLWALALLLVLNPPRAAFGIPRTGRSAREIAAIGGAIGALGVVAVATLADPLLDALDVSPPAIRLAAGIVAVLAGATDLIRRPPSADPALPGRRAALVPVAIPIVARPALVVMALGAGADHSALVTLAPTAIAVALLTWLATRGPTESPRARVLRWTTRLLAAGLIAAGVALAIDGVLAV
jgi:small neutral amino acid transporter SnatA (MarC family)